MVGATTATGGVAVQAAVDSRGAAALIAALGVVLLLPGATASPPWNGPPVATGKVVANGVFGVPFADTSTLTFPSLPPFGASPLDDGNLVYDTQVSIEIVDAGNASVDLPVITETWTPGTTTIYETRGSGNNTTVVPVQVPARLDPSWANATVSALAESTGIVTLQLVDVGSVQPLEVKVGNAVWELQYLTAATSVISAVYTGGGFWGFVLGFSAETFIAVGVAIVAAKQFAARVHSVPPVPWLWPAFWGATPILAFLLLYVPVNQALGGISPFVAPMPVAIAAFPWFARTFSKRTASRLQGLELRGLGDARKSEAIVYTVETEQGLRCAPRTWPEAFYAFFGVPLPEVEGEELDVLGHRVMVKPRGLAIAKMLPQWEYRPEADHELWVDISQPLTVANHRWRWTREITVQKEVTQPDGSTRIEKRLKRRFSPHVERGYIRGRFPPAGPVLSVMSSVRQAEDLAHENEALHVAVAEMRGTIWSKIRAARVQSLAKMEDALRRRGEPRTEDELRRQVEAGASSGRKHGSSEASRNASEGEG